MKRALSALLVAAGVAFVATVVLLMSLEEQILFPTHAVPEPGPLPAEARMLEAQAASGETLAGVHIPPANGRDDDLLLVGFGGNGWNGSDVAAMLHRIMPGAHVVAFHYRGYRPSQGRPSASALIEDAPRVFDAALEASGKDRAVAVGMSIGSGVAAHLARERDLAGIVLVTPFDSLRKVASDAFPFLPTGMLFRNEIASAEALAGQDIPVAIIASGRDEIIPPRRTAALRDAVERLVFDRTYDEARHNDLYVRPDFAADLRRAISAVTGTEQR